MVAEYGQYTFSSRFLQSPIRDDAMVKPHVGGETLANKNMRLVQPITII